MKNIKPIEIIIIMIITALLSLMAWKSILPMTLTEVLGFVTGAACVWLTVKENIWNWPIGLANNIFFIILFWNAQLYADMGLQVIYIFLGVYGWYWWLYGGKDKTEAAITKVDNKTVIILMVIALIATFGMTKFLESVNDSAPFWDALTTVMSLVAQYLLTKKYLENWYVWISVDVIYIWLYFYKELYLTGVLYFIFLIMCIVGWQAWKKTLSRNLIKEGGKNV